MIAKSAAEDEKKAIEAEEELPDGDVDLADDLPAGDMASGTPEEVRLLEAQTRQDESDANTIDGEAGSAKSSSSITNEPIVGSVSGGASTTFLSQLQKAIDTFLEVNSKTKKRAEEVKTFATKEVIEEINNSEDESIKETATSSFLDSVMSDSFDKTFDAIPEGEFKNAKLSENALVATLLRNKDIIKLFYFDETKIDIEGANFSKGISPIAQLSRYNDKSAKSLGTSLEDVRLKTDSIIGYSDNSEYPSFVLDQKLYIQGVDVSEHLKGSVSVSKSSVSGHNTLTFTLDNSNDRFVWTDRNLGLPVFGRNYFYDENGNKVDYYQVQKAAPDQPGSVQISPNLISPFLQYEDVKAKIFQYKSNINVNPIGVDAAGNKMFTRFDLVPNKCVFNRMDPVRLFTLYPFRPQESSNEALWMPEFAGFIESVSIEDDDVLGTSTITIECADIRQSILTRMRISSSVSSSLTNPLDLLGLKPVAIYDEGAPGIVSGGPTDQQQGIIDQIRKESPVFFDEKNKTVTFYDDVSNSPNNTFVSPNLNLEGAVRELLEFKYDALSSGRARRGVNNIQYGGTFRTPWGITETGSTQITTYKQIREFLQEYHMFTLFGPKRRPWTTAEVEYVGSKTVTTDPSGLSLGDFTPLNSRLWFLFPLNNTGPSNVVELTVANIQLSHEANWTNRIEVLRNIIEGVDYHMYVSGTGDIHIEFPFADFRPEDFGLFKDAFRFHKATISTSYSDEAEEPIAGLTVVTGFSANAEALPEVAEDFLQKTFAFSPYIAARYGMNVTQTVSVPYLSYTDKAIAQQRAIIEFQKANARCNTVQFQSAFRPFLLPNRPVHHIRRSRMGIVVSSETTFEIGASPRASISVGLEHVRTWTGGYQDEAKPLASVQEPSEFTTRETSKDVPADQKGTTDPYTSQVFTSIMSGTNLPTSNRAVWGVTSPVVANSGVYVIDLNKFTEEQISKDEPPAPTPTPQDTIPKPENATPASVVTPPPDEDHKKWTSNPLKDTPLDLTSYWQPVRVLGGKARPHEGIDFGRKGQTAPEVIAVNDGIVISSEQRGYGSTIVLDATKENGLKALYGHLGPVRMIPKSNFPESESSDYDTAQSLAKNYAAKESEYRKKAEASAASLASAVDKVQKVSKSLEEAKKAKDSARVVELERDLVAAQKSLTDAASSLATVKATEPKRPSSKYYMENGKSYPTKSGEVIGFMSNSGGDYPVHLHFETHDSQHPVTWPYDYSEFFKEIGNGSQLQNGSIKVNPYTYLPGPIDKPNKTGEDLDAFIRGRLEELKQKVIADRKK